jgi:Na+/H+ antiporter NhaD/arsenite permease-like protein
VTAIAIVVFVVAYVLIATERIHKTIAALAGAAVVLAVGVLDSEQAFFSHDTGADWDVVLLLFGMMVIVGVLRQTGVFEYTAIWAAKRAKGSPVRVMILLTLITAVASAFLDNVTTVLLIAAPAPTWSCSVSPPAPGRRSRSGSSPARVRWSPRSPSWSPHRICGCATSY